MIGFQFRVIIDSQPAFAMLRKQAKSKKEKKHHKSKSAKDSLKIQLKCHSSSFVLKAFKNNK